MYSGESRHRSLDFGFMAVTILVFLGWSDQRVELESIQMLPTTVWHLADSEQLSLKEATPLIKYFI